MQSLLQFLQSTYGFHKEEKQRKEDILNFQNTYESTLSASLYEKLLGRDKERRKEIMLSGKNSVTSKISSTPPLYFLHSIFIFYHSKIIYSTKIAKIIPSFDKIYDIMKIEIRKGR